MNETITCNFCNSQFTAKYAKSCGNCFACTGCEIYHCPFCNKEIVIVPLKKS